MIDSRERRLIDYVNSVNGSKYIWGVTDCASLFLNAATIITGEKAWRELICWKTKKEALSAYKSIKCFEYLRAQKCKKIDERFLSRGDFIVGKDKESRLPSFYTCAGRSLMTSAENDGVYLLPRTFAVENIGRLSSAEISAWRF